MSRRFQFLNSPGLPSAIERYTKVVASVFRGKGLGASQHSIQEYKRAFSSAENLLNYLAENYIVINKNEISAVSGYFCNRCFAFESRYIRDIGFDLTAQDVHKCNPSRVREISVGKDNENLGYTIFYNAVNYLIYLTKSLFSQNIQLSVRSFSLTANLKAFNGRRLSEDIIGPNHWAWELLSRKTVKLSEESLRNFIGLAEGTYLLLSVKNGPYQGQYLISVTEARTR